MSQPDEWTHEALVLDLAEDRALSGYLSIYELSLGQFGSGGFVDVASVKPSWTRAARPTFYEVKVSRPDLLADLRAEKWRNYLPFCQLFYFATPAGLTHRKEIPKECGLVMRNENGWHTVRAPTWGEPLPPENEAWFWRAVAIAHSPASFKRARPVRTDQLAAERARRILVDGLSGDGRDSHGRLPLPWLAKVAANRIRRLEASTADKNDVSMPQE